MYGLSSGIREQGLGFIQAPIFKGEVIYMGTLIIRGKLMDQKMSLKKKDVIKCCAFYKLK